MDDLQLPQNIQQAAQRGDTNTVETWLIEECFLWDAETCRDVAKTLCGKSPKVRTQ